jgi:hypothetical protein
MGRCACGFISTAPCFFVKKGLISDIPGMAHSFLSKNR